MSYGRPLGPAPARRPLLAIFRALIATVCAVVLIVSLTEMIDAGSSAWPGPGGPTWSHLRWHSDLWWLAPLTIIYLIGAIYARVYEARWWHTLRGLAVCLSLMMGAQGAIIAANTSAIPRRFFAIGEFSLLANGRWPPALTAVLAGVIIAAVLGEWLIARTGQGLLTWPVIIGWALITIGFFSAQLSEFGQSGAMRLYRIAIWAQDDYFWRILLPAAPALLVITIVVWAAAVLTHPQRGA